MKRYKVTISDIYYVDADSEEEAIDIALSAHCNEPEGENADYSHGDCEAEEA